eukprot:PhF_6_TR22566/c0_g1_i4/m.32134/K07407/E3.2.1.22B, galA, rafA; alpha-galactosidase
MSLLTSILFAVCVITTWEVSHAVTPNRKPAMGWSTWNSLACSITESNIANAVDQMVSLGLVNAGWTGLHIDDCWVSGRDPQGNIIPDPKVFPSGFNATVARIAQAGMKLGLYTARGANTCEGRPGILGHEAQDAAFYAAHNTSYLKVDSCGNYGNLSAWEEYDAVAKALRGAFQSRGISPPYVETCEMLTYLHNPTNYPLYGPEAFTVGPWLAEGLPIDTIANAVLIEFKNMVDTWDQTMSNYDASYYLTSRMLTMAGLTNHLDMMTLCMGSMARIEYRTQLSLWSIMGSPLILGNNFAATDADCVKDVMLNAEVIAVNQDDLVAPAQKIFDTMVTIDSSIRVLKNKVMVKEYVSPVTIWWQVLMRPLASGGFSTVVFCREAPVNASTFLSKFFQQEVLQFFEGDATEVEVTMGRHAKYTQVFKKPSDPVTYGINVSLTMFGLPSKTKVQVRDLWGHSSFNVTGSVPATLQPHEVAHWNIARI